MMNPIIPAASFIIEFLDFSSAARLPGGKVPCKVLEAPQEYPFLLNQICHLRINNREFMSPIQLSPMSKKLINRSFCFNPSVNGWKDVGFLEIYAKQALYARKICSLENYRILEPDQTVPEIAIDAPPMIIGGHYYSLVRFQPKSSSQENAYVVSHYNPETGAFDGKEDVYYARTANQERVRFPFQITSLQGITCSPWNDSGYYVYGSYDDKGRFIIDSLQPRAFVSLDNIKKHTQQTQNWRLMQTRPGKNFQAIVPGIPHPFDSFEHFLSFSCYVPGKIKWNKWFTFYRWFFDHNASWIFVFNEFINSGHIGFGLAKTARCPFTSEPILETRLYEIMFYSPFGYFSGIYDWASYYGNLSDGICFKSTVFDLHLALDHAADRNLIEAFMREAFSVNTGEGIGIIVPNLQNNCLISMNRIFAKSLEQNLNSPLHRALERSFLKSKTTPFPNVQFEKICAAAIEEKIPLILLNYSFLDVLRSDFESSNPLFHWNGDPFKQARSKSCAQ